MGGRRLGKARRDRTPRLPEDNATAAITLPAPAPLVRDENTQSAVQGELALQGHIFPMSILSPIHSSSSRLASLPSSQCHNLTTETADTFLTYARTNLPAGVNVRLKLVGSLATASSPPRSPFVTTNGNLIFPCP